MARGKRRGKKTAWRKVAKRALLLLVAIPALYLAVALVGGLAPVNPGWDEPDDGVTIYIADNGVHADIVMPVEAAGLDWTPILPKSDVRAAPAGAQWVAFGMGERRVYLETPRWRDIRPGTIWAALTGGERVMHVEWVANPAYAARQIRLRPEEYRRLWAAIRSGFDLDSNGLPQRIDFPGYGRADAFYEGVGRANAFDTCNQWAASRLRIAGIESSLWSPFVQGLTWRYREATSD